GRGGALRAHDAAGNAARPGSRRARAPGARQQPALHAARPRDRGGRVRVDGPARRGGGMRGTFSRLWAIALKELLQLRRDRLTLAMMVALPVVQLMLFGYAIDTDVRHMPTVVFDQDRTAQSRDFAQSMRATGFYDLAGEVHGYDEIAQALRRGDARVALVVPPGYASDLARGRTARLQLVVDGSDPQTVASATNAAAGLAQARSAQRPRISVEPATWYNPDLKTSIYIVPGLIGVILTMTMVMLTAMAVARERERGTL